MFFFVEVVIDIFIFWIKKQKQKGIWNPSNQQVKGLLVSMPKIRTPIPNIISSSREWQTQSHTIHKQKITFTGDCSTEHASQPLLLPLLYLWPPLPINISISIPSFIFWYSFQSLSPSSIPFQHLLFFRLIKPTPFFFAPPRFNFPSQKPTFSPQFITCFW